MEQNCPKCGKSVKGVSSPTLRDLVAMEAAKSTVLIDPAPNIGTTMKDWAKAGKNAIMNQKQVDFACPACGTKWQMTVKDKC